LNLNCGKKLWGCRNYKNSSDKGCSYFKLVNEDDVMDERDLKIEKQKLKIEKHKKKKNKLKSELSRTRQWLIMTLFLDFYALGLCCIRNNVSLQNHIHYEWILFEIRTMMYLGFVMNECNVLKSCYECNV